MKSEKHAARGVALGAHPHGLQHALQRQQKRKKVKKNKKRRARGWKRLLSEHVQYWLLLTLLAPEPGERCGSGGHAGGVVRGWSGEWWGSSIPAAHP